MNLNVGNMVNEIARELAHNGTDIGCAWNELPPGAVPDAVDGAVDGLIPRTEIRKAFVHQVGTTNASSVRRFNEVEVGDLILDFAADAPLDGRRDQVFSVNGKLYTAKEVGEKLAASWDVTVQGRQLFRSVLVKVKP